MNLINSKKNKLRIEWVSCSLWNSVNNCFAIHSVISPSCEFNMIFHSHVYLKNTADSEKIFPHSTFSLEFLCHPFVYERRLLSRNHIYYKDSILLLVVVSRLHVSWTTLDWTKYNSIIHETKYELTNMIYSEILWIVNRWNNERQQSRNH